MTPHIELAPGTEEVEAWVPVIGGRVHLHDVSRSKEHVERVVAHAEENGIVAELRPCVVLVGAPGSFVPEAEGASHV